MNYLDYLVNNIHSTVVATIDDKGLPQTRVIDMMHYDEKDKDCKIYGKLLGAD